MPAKYNIKFLDIDLKFKQWPGSVKSLDFVNALRSHFIKKWSAYGHLRELEEDFRAKKEDGCNHIDKWALAYLTPLKAQSIGEALDSDANGFITITEINSYTTLRPDWR